MCKPWRLALFLCFTLLPLSLWGQSRTEMWKQVDQAVSEGLPKTAIERLQPIIKQTLEEKAYAEAIKAIGMRIALEGNIQGNQPAEKVTRMEAEIAAAPEPMQPVMRAVLANWYWHYFQQNRWRFMQRTQTAAAPSDDFTTWDLPRILAYIDQQFQTVLASADQLQQIPVSDYDALLEKGNADDTYRPTLYDVLAFNALDFYSAGEQAGSRTQGSFDLSADSPIFDDMQSFIDWNPDTTDGESRLVKAVRIYQQLLKFHQDDTDRTALLDADLLRLNFGNNEAFGENKSDRYMAALSRFVDAHQAHEISARALHDWGTVLQQQGDRVKAHEKASLGLKRFPDSVGGRRCFNLLQEIEAREVQITTERVWNQPAPTIDVSYRNVNKVYFRLVKYDFERFLKGPFRWQLEALDQDERNQLLSQSPVKSWSADLPPTPDYQQKVESLAAPLDVPAGSYFLISSHNESFSNQDNQVGLTHVWVSQLALVTRTRNNQGITEGFVLDAASGNPIAGARIEAWQRTRNNQNSPLAPTKTDKNGWFVFRQATPQGLFLLATHQKQQISSLNFISTYDQQPPQRRVEQTRFFTDRALYRPGQTIRYKGICMAFDHGSDEYETLAQRKLTVILRDVNGEEVSRLEHRTNDYGSFNGSVTAPRGRLTGAMTLQVDGAPQGATSVRVEEYKRPKFQVTVDPPKEPAKLDEEVVVQGKATAYTGAAIGGAQVQYRVVREVRFPPWWYWRCWWMPPTQSSPQEIAHGVATSGPDGTFQVAFTARPDASVSRDSEPTFQFKIYADVTDQTGETRSGQQTVNVGYTALTTSLTADNWQTNEDPVSIAVRATTLDGEGRATEGTLKVSALQQPEQVARPELAVRPRLPQPLGKNASEPAEPDLANPNSWELGKLVAEQPVKTNPAGSATADVKLDAGIYRAIFDTQDAFGAKVTAMLQITVLDTAADALNIRIPNLFAAESTTLEPGDELLAVWGSGYEQARAFIEVEHKGRILQSFWTDPNDTQVTLRQKVDESMRGGFTVRTTMVRENRAYLETHSITVPWSNKRLTIEWEHFVSKLKPGQEDQWTAIISGPDAEPAAAEMVATLYDASLDAYQPHHWMDSFGVFRQDYSNLRSQFENSTKHLQPIYHSWSREYRDGSLTYRHFPASVIAQITGYGFMSRNRMMRKGGALGAPMAEMAMDAAPAPMAMAAMAADGAVESEQAKTAGPGGEAPPEPDLSNVSARKNLEETAFFFPHLVSREDGKVELKFTMPEALTEWKFFGFAHDKQLRGGLLSSSTVTAKDLMVEPNPPRFVREGDLLEFTVKVSNQSPTIQTGKVRLTFQDARTGDSSDTLIENTSGDQSFEIPSGESKTLAWKIRIPDGLGFQTYKAVGSTGRLSDGEEGYLPVLSRKVMVTESLPLPIRGMETKQFEFERLLKSAQSDSLENKQLTVQMVSNPSWYAVMALPYLMEYPHQCSEQTFNRLYANTLAHKIATSDPKIDRVFQQWRGTPALDSPLAQNEDLKSVMLEETPWLRDSNNESQARRNVGILFDHNRLQDETARAQQELVQMQLDDGMWPWFPGGRKNEYITLYITTGYGRLRHLGVPVAVAPAVKSLHGLDQWMTEWYQRITNREENHLSATIALYLYGRSFFMDDHPIADEHREAFEYWQKQAQVHWLKLANRQSQGHMALALKRLGDRQTPAKIMASIKERSVSDEELGMFWRDQELSWWWFRAPIESQAVMIEAFDEVMGDQQAVEDCKVWLLKQKQTQDWKTTKATADAVYALLLRGTNQLASDALVEVKLGSKTIEPQDVQAGTGFYEQRFYGGDIKPQQGKITVRKLDEGVAWGSVHWQYMEDMTKVTAYEGTPLKLTKNLFVKKNTADGPKLTAVDGPVAVGDELVVRVVLRSDRDMEYLHLKDYRGSGTEPVNVLSRYQYQDGLAYYESTRDTASHFFIDYLPKGTYVFEYSTRVQLRGEYQTGFATIQCMYAPEFNSHSESLQLKVE